jgi:hypothetical protein
MTGGVAGEGAQDVSELSDEFCLGARNTSA